MLENITEKEFSLAVCEAVCKSTDMELDSCVDYVPSVSYKHKQKMRTILRCDAKIKPFKKRIAALCAALLMLFAGIAVYAHYTSGSYLVEITDGEYVRFAFRAGAECDKTLQESASLGSVTDGFVLTETSENENSISYVYRGRDGQLLRITQTCLGQIFLTLPHGYETNGNMFVHGYKTWCFESDGRSYYLYNDGRYAYLLECDNTISRDSARSMLEAFVTE